MIGETIKNVKSTKNWYEKTGSEIIEKTERVNRKSIYEQHQQPTNQQPLIIKHEENKLRWVPMTSKFRINSWLSFGDILYINLQNLQNR